MSHFADDETLAHIAALELEVVRLRNALETFIAEHEECEDGDGWMAQMCSMEALHVADEAMSTPFTPTALNKLVEKVEKRTIERCAVITAMSIIDMPTTVEISTVRKYSKAINALPVGQIDLKEIL